MDQCTRGEMLDGLAKAAGSIAVAHPTRVAIDGPPASGKTTLADELAVVLRAQGRTVIRATIDDFLFPRAQRYPRGEYSPEGCYFDTHDYDTLNRVCSIHSGLAVGPTHLRVYRSRDDRESGRSPRAPSVISGRSRATLARAVHPVPTVLLRYCPPDRSRRHRRAQRRASRAGLGDPNRLTALHAGASAEASIFMPSQPRSSPWVGQLVVVMYLPPAVMKSAA